ncbi:hypothetical protein [Sphingomonas ursincola]|uniref:hypothetical protein n=1 Tax=Sphingomonas ursincola TaxID=56361 RepID=UPI002353E0D8|nr:hypothetical protein [Sphingomonas ursincola]
MRLRIVILAALVAATPGYAADVAGLMKTVPVFSKVTGKNMYELERCMIEVDGPIMPHVYRQPDRPQRVMMVWDGGGGVGGVSAAVLIDGIEDAKVTFWGREKVLRRIKPCMELAYSG